MGLLRSTDPLHTRCKPESQGILLRHPPSGTPKTVVPGRLKAVYQ